MRARVNFDDAYTRQFIASHKRYTDRYQRLIYPQRVYPDPVYSQTVVIVELPFSLPFRVEQVFWDSSRLSHRMPVYKPDFIGFFSAFTSGDKEGHPLFSILFTGEDVFLIFQKWLCFITPQGVNLLQKYYDNQSKPQGISGYETRVVNYEKGLIYADHFHLRKIMSGITIA